MFSLVDIAYMFAYFVMLYSSVLWFSVFFRNHNTFLDTPKAKVFPSVTFLIPAYNEGKRINKCLEALLKLNYPKEKVKIIVINDGSKDNTGEVVSKFKKFGIKVLNKVNEGKKSKALNFALESEKINTELLACMDADSYPDRNYLRRMVGYFEDEKISAVTPAMKVAAVKTMAQKMQWVEYMFSIFLRRLFSIFKCQYVFPGPGSIYRTKIIKSLGGFDENNATEDMELAFRFYEYGLTTENSPNSYVYTDCPAKFSELFKQRLRWYRGYLQNVKLYKHMIMNPAYGNLGLFLLPINFVWILILAFLFFYPISIWAEQIPHNFEAWVASGFMITLPSFKGGVLYTDLYSFFWTLFWAMNIITIYISIKSGGEDIKIWKRKSYYLVYMFIYPLALSIFWFSSVGAELLGLRKKW